MPEPEWLWPAASGHFPGGISTVSLGPKYPLRRNLRSSLRSDAARRDVIKTLLRLGQPIVVFQETFRFQSADVCVIRQADRVGGALVAKEVLERGAKHVVILVPETEWPAIGERVAGARAVMSAAAGKSQFDIVHLRRRGLPGHPGRPGELREGNGFPDAILAGNDQMGIAAMKHMISRGRNVPRDVAVTGFNAFEFWQFTNPMLTTVRSPAYEMGARGGEELLARLTKGRFERHEIVFPVELQRAALPEVLPVAPTCSRGARQ